MITLIGAQALGDVGLAQSSPSAQNIPSIGPVGSTQNDSSGGSQFDGSQSGGSNSGGSSSQSGAASQQHTSELQANMSASAELALNSAVSQGQAAPQDQASFEPPVIVFSANMVTGPTPTFQVSLMDIGNELRNEIAMAQAKQTLIPASPEQAPLEMSLPQSNLTSEMSSAVSSEALSSPTERRDAQISIAASDSERPVSPAQTAPEMVMPVDIQDPEAAYAGMAALQVRPYDGVNIAV